MKTKTHLAKRLDTRSTALAIMKVSGGILIQPKSESKQLSGCVSGLILKAPTLEVSSFLKKKQAPPTFGVYRCDSYSSTEKCLFAVVSFRMVI